ncbi:hypothetical protein FBU30_008148 [Linnemannia zychae]|nr:hypothetical protein FBU30_008148 [Linnemannia zychae]
MEEMGEEEGDSAEEGDRTEEDDDDGDMDEKCGAGGSVDDDEQRFVVPDVEGDNTLDIAGKIEVEDSFAGNESTVLVAVEDLTEGEDTLMES